jgi:hypothetical protein
VPSPRVAVPGLRCEPGDDAVERHIVVILLARELLDVVSATKARHAQLRMWQEIGALVNPPRDRSAALLRSAL